AAAALSRSLRRPPRLPRFRFSLSHRQSRAAGGSADRHFQARLPGHRSRLVHCAVCHTGTYRTSEGAARVTVAGMPSNNLDLYRFSSFVLAAGADERLGPDRLIPAMQAAGANFSPIERAVWKFYVIPRVREGFIQRRSRLEPFLAEQAAWGPGRVDTFNPYKLV